MDRYALDRERIQYLPPTAYLDELFMAEETRKVRADNTFPFQSSRYEAPADVRCKEIHVRFDKRPKGQHLALFSVPVYYKGQRLGEAKLVDLHGNDRPPKNDSKTNNTTNRNKPTRNKQ